jgi:hypothetical protein
MRGGGAGAVSVFQSSELLMTTICNNNNTSPFCTCVRQIINIGVCVIDTHIFEMIIETTRYAPYISHTHTHEVYVSQYNTVNERESVCIYV